ncbi:MAG: DNA gyrase subunit A [Parcubacteria group bacterium Gr01-1014_31]|nr:MAG: DNA gyrase subunit A [Parcubacteria group bacterium Gr01-1014_31]
MAPTKKTTPPPAAPERISVQARPIELEMQESYLDYAMSVIIARALPDVRDGLKPVHRRVLYAMWTLGLRPGSKFRKSATIVGECLGKYHPHGDIAVYDSLVRMAQDFSLRYPLVAGQGNFGSMDGDSAAAMRYTEAKMAGIAEELLVDIDKETVSFVANYDGTHQEPTVLPGRLPNLILNGSTGIAVGMATNIPPHNLSEVVDATIHLADHADATVDGLMQYVQGPDFPTGGTIFDKREIKQAYATGKGAIVTRAKAEIIEQGNGHHIVVTEIPYMVNKAMLLEKIAELVKDKKMEGIRDLRDESSERGGLRVVIELKKDAYPRKVLNQLYQHTQLQETYHVNLLALVDGIQPRVLTLKAILEEYLKHRREVIKRRTAYDLARAEERAHILEGLKLALAKIDEIIATIKKSQDKDEARINLIKRFKLSERQAVAILEMRLQQLANLERLQIEQELKAKLALIKELQAILKSAARITGIIKDELKALKEKYGDARRTQVVAHGVKEFTQEDLIPDEDVIIALSRNGYIKALPPDSFRTQERGGKGVIGLATKDEDFVAHFFSTTTHTNILFFTSSGRVFQLLAYEIPKASRQSRGTAIVNFLQLGPNERISAALPMPEKDEAKFLVMVTTRGQIKKVSLDDFVNVRRSGLIAIRLHKDDILDWVKPSSGQDSILLVTAQGQSIRFPERQLRPMGRPASGVRGLRLKGNDTVVGMDVIDPALVNVGQLLTVMAHGFGKRSTLKAYKTQGRGGSGIKTAKITPKTGPIVSAIVVNSQSVEADLIIVSIKGQVIRLPLNSVSVLGRATQGVRLMRFKEEDDRVASVTLL